MRQASVRLSPAADRHRMVRNPEVRKRTENAQLFRARMYGQEAVTIDEKECWRFHFRLTSIGRCRQVEGGEERFYLGDD